LFIADHTDGIEVIDVQKPKNPVEIAQWNNGGEITNLDTINNLIIAADQLNGSRILLIDGLDLGEISYFKKSTPGWTFLVLLFGIISLNIFYRKKKQNFSNANHYIISLGLLKSLERYQEFYQNPLKIVDFGSSVTCKFLFSILRYD